MVRDAMERADGWFMCRAGFVETVRAVGSSAGRAAARAFEREWPSFGLVEVDQRLVEDAADLALSREAAKTVRRTYGAAFRAGV